VGDPESAGPRAGGARHHRVDAPRYFADRRPARPLTRAISSLPSRQRRLGKERRAMAEGDATGMTGATGRIRRPSRLTAVIVGAGLSGLLAGIRLKQAGIHSFVILERDESVGGTWFENS